MIKISGKKLTARQLAALVWLADRYGDGIITFNNDLLAAGEYSPHKLKTYGRLQELGLVEYYNGSRIRLTDAARSGLKWLR